jgi:hypothetical protein
MEQWQLHFAQRHRWWTDLLPYVPQLSLHTCRLANAVSPFSLLSPVLQSLATTLPTLLPSWLSPMASRCSSETRTFPFLFPFVFRFLLHLTILTLLPLPTLLLPPSIATSAHTTRAATPTKPLASTASEVEWRPLVNRISLPTTAPTISGESCASLVAGTASIRTRFVKGVFICSVVVLLTPCSPV